MYFDPTALHHGVTGAGCECPVSWYPPRYFDRCSHWALSHKKRISEIGTGFFFVRVESTVYNRSMWLRLVLFAVVSELHDVCSFGSTNAVDTNGKSCRWWLTTVIVTITIVTENVMLKHHCRSYSIYCGSVSQRSRNNDFVRWSRLGRYHLLYRCFSPMQQTFGFCWTYLRMATLNMLWRWRRIFSKFLHLGYKPDMCAWTHGSPQELIWARSNLTCTFSVCFCGFQSYPGEPERWRVWLLFFSHIH